MNFGTTCSTATPTTTWLTLVPKSRFVDQCDLESLAEKMFLREKCIGVVIEQLCDRNFWYLKQTILKTWSCLEFVLELWTIRELDDVIDTFEYVSVFLKNVISSCLAILSASVKTNSATENQNIRSEICRKQKRRRYLVSLDKRYPMTHELLKISVDQTDKELRNLTGIYRYT